MIPRAVDLQVAFFFNFRYFGANTTSHIIFLASTSYSSLQHHTPRFNIILLASTSYSTLLHHTPRSLHTTSIKLATTPPPPQLPTINVHRVATFPAGWMETRRDFPPKRRRKKKRQWYAGFSRPFLPPIASRARIPAQLPRARDGGGAIRAGGQR